MRLRRNELIYIVFICTIVGVSVRESGCTCDENDIWHQKNGNLAITHYIYPVEEEVSHPFNDMTAIRREGQIRVLVSRAEVEEIPRSGSASYEDINRAASFADKLGLGLKIIAVEQKQQLVSALREAKGDLIATLLRSDEEQEDVAFSITIRQVQIVAVVKKDGKNTIQSKQQLIDQSLVVSSQDVCRPTLKKLEKELGADLNIVFPPENLDVEDVLYRVGTGQYSVALARSDQVQAYLSYRDDVEVAFPIEKKVPLAWAVRKQATNMLDAVNGFLYEHSLTTHRRDKYGGDLDTIKKRKVIRVGMLNNAVSYFIYRGQEVGFQFDLADLFAQRLDVRLEVVVPKRPSGLRRLLVENRADLVAVSLVANNPFPNQVEYSTPFSYSNQVLVQPSGEKSIQFFTELTGKEIHVRESSQYYRTLRLVSFLVPGLKIVAAPEDIETEDLIDLVAKKEIPLTVANSILLGTELTHREDVKGTLSFAEELPLVYAVRKDSHQLLQRINRFVKKVCKSPLYKELYRKYFTYNKRMIEVRADALATSGIISPYDKIVRKYSRRYGLDWRLVLAQMYQESKFDPKALSWAGAQGLLQVMPQTAREIGLEALWDPETNIHAGVKYLSGLIRRFEPILPMRQRIRFALAAYNAGYGHVKDARNLTKELGLNPSRWFGNVENAIILLEKPKYYSQARHGYCRGSEPVQYVSRIQTKYDAYVRLMPAEGKKQALH